MSKLVYEVVEHNGGWAYKADGTFSETFDSRDEAVAAARRAAGEQQVSDAGGDIEYEDEKGKWHLEPSAGDDRPETEVKT